jgi:predicted metal-dependent hydrolase
VNPTPTLTAPAPPRQTSDPTRVVPTRRISFEESVAELPRHFAEDGDVVASHLVAVLSSVFPDGEDFFVRSVRHYRDRITDPALKRQVAGFIGQESVHGREHRVLNDRLAELGYPTHRIAAIAKWGLTTRERILPPASNLALTAALEHFTATLAELVMDDDELRRTMHHPAVRDVFLWHALEESEHKAVAFDVYRAVGAPEWLRILTMKLIRVGFVGTMAVFLAASLAGDRATYRRGALRASVRRLRDSSLLSAETWRQLRDYDRRDFHPDDRDTTALVEHWRTELFGAEGRLNDLLAGPPAAA